MYTAEEEEDPEEYIHMSVLCGKIEVLMDIADDSSTRVYSQE